jgi:mono/diheme cytochrome c family protein
VGIVFVTAASTYGGESAISASDCPQPRFTGKAPEEFLARKNPIGATERDLAAAERLYAGPRNKIGCATCHGATGNGKGPMSDHFSPPPRNFACAKTVNGIPDGQLFWIIRYGSPGTAMPPHRELTDQQIWQLVTYLRRLAR